MRNLSNFIIFIVFLFSSHHAFSWDGKLSTGQVLSNTPGEEGVHEFASPSEKVISRLITLSFVLVFPYMLI